MAEPKMISTKAYVVESKGAPFILKEVILDEVQPNEVLVEMKYTGLCHTDVVVQQGGMPIGMYPAVLGHEGVGVVKHVGSDVADKSLLQGDIVLLSFHSCQRCRACFAGRCGSCPHMTETNFIATARKGPGPKSPISLPDGSPVHGQFFGQSSLSKLAVVAETSVVKVPAARPSDLPFLAPLACGYLTGAGTVLNVLKPERDHTVVVLGMGAVGLAAVMAAKAVGVETVVGVDIVDSKLELASVLGATYMLNTNKVGLEEGIRDLFADGADFIVDATGVASLHGPAMKALAHEGTLALVGVPPPTARLEVDTLDFLLSCKRLVGVIEGQSNPQQLIPQLLDLYHQGKFPINLISKCYPAECLSQAIEDLKSGIVVKPILSWDNIK
ncbi:GroES-like protein [Melanomma pulvis-pyrius CBS 109.77]|uniref:GroES-like protein n=1 Tax=Melanomma pulvis-pyrius CBS 109.77 TaxID=1314802 RepID=A0A6A6WWR7_9PLEO|nr:GroES-like protein [Melanomma pulvis-pyrius CBS 109.77]